MDACNNRPIERLAAWLCDVAEWLCEVDIDAVDRKQEVKGQHVLNDVCIGMTMWMF